MKDKIDAKVALLAQRIVELQATTEGSTTVYEYGVALTNLATAATELACHFNGAFYGSERGRSMLNQTMGVAAA